MAATDAPLRVSHGYAIDAKEAREFAKQLWRLPEEKIADLPGVPTRRAATLPAAALVIDRVLKRLEPERVVFSLVAWTDDLFPGETPAEKRLRVAACALSDIAWRDAGGVQAADSFRRLVQFPFIGLDHPERVLLAATIHARYAGSPDDAVLSPAITLLSPAA